MKNRMERCPHNQNREHNDAAQQMFLPVPGRQVFEPQVFARRATIPSNTGAHSIAANGDGQR
jgi:hypothetical protein